MTLATADAAGQWYNWRGPAQDGASSETGLPGHWSLEGENLAWKVPIGARSTPVVLGDHVYLMTRGGEGESEHERVVCLALRSGKVLWEHRMPIFHTDIPSNRVGWSSPAGDPETGNVYVHGIQGLFTALDRNGKVLWSHALMEEFGRFSGYGGRVQTPVVAGDLVIVSFLNSSWGKQARMWHRFLALDKHSGEVRWWSSPGYPPRDTNYSTPVVATVKGRDLLIAGGGDGSVYALKVETGEPVWTFRLSKRGVNSSVVVEGDRVYASHSEENLDTTTMGRLVAIDATGEGDVTETGEVWRVDGIRAGYASPALHGGKIYVVDNSANLWCIATRDGKVHWKHSLGTVGKGSPVWADGKIYVAELNGRFHILEDGAEECRSLDLQEFPTSNGGMVEIYGSPAVARGHVFFSTQNETFALGGKEFNVQAVPLSVTRERPAAPGGAPAHLQLLPAEVHLSPGEQVKFRGRLFDASGRFLRDARELTLKPQGLRGTISGTEFRASPENTHQAGLVEASAGELRGAARVRVIPELPIHEDFEKYVAGDLPPGWIGVNAAKFQLAERDGSRALQKRADNPKFYRAKVHFGRPDWSGYTLQADVLGTYARRNLPDIGLYCCRYTFYLTKNPRTRKNVVQIMAWDPMPRIQKSVPYDWKPDVWYRMKVRVDPRGEKGVVRGKVWPRDEPEPGQWTIEVEDSFPTLSGSPGFTAFTPGITTRSQGPLVFFDNILVTKNLKDYP